MLTDSRSTLQITFSKRFGGNTATAIVLFFLGIVSAAPSFAQNIALNHWESHFSYLSAQHVIQVENKIFCSSYNGLFYIDTGDKEVKILSKAEGLSETGISSMAYSSLDKTLLLTYKSGNIDLVTLNEKFQPDQILPWPVLINASDLPDAKQINQVLISQDLAYLATNFGVVVLNTRLREVQETYRYIEKNGNEANVKNIAFDSDSIYVLTTANEILASSMKSSVNRQFFSNWKTVATPAPVVSISDQGNYLYAGFAGKGIFKKSGGAWISIYSSGSPYYSFSNSVGIITATLDKKVVVIPDTSPNQLFESTLFEFPKESLFTENKILWTADSKKGLISNIDGNFKSFSPVEKDTTINPRTDSIVVDQNGNTWARLPVFLGGGIVFKNTKNNQERILTTGVGHGGLPSSGVNSLAVDAFGSVWFASDNGVGYFIADDILASTRIDAILPLYGQRRLFANEKCTSLAIEPGNRKWVGTRNGLYLFNEDGSELIQKFTAEDSPLPSNNISALNFISEQGLLFIDTPNGMVAYRSGSTGPSVDFSSTTIFPNPVHPGYAGMVGIKGLLNNSTVKILQLSGRLVYETKSQGGTASWNLNDYSGKRVRGGIYLVLIVSENGEKKVAGKLAIIN